MIPTFVRLAVAGGALRVALNGVLRRYFGLSLSLPQGLAGVLLLLAVLPDIITPIDINLPLGLVVGLLLQWQLSPFAAAVAIVVAAQLLAMKRLLSDPKRLAPWYNATGVSLYVLGMMSAAIGLGGWLA